MDHKVGNSIAKLYSAKNTIFTLGEAAQVLGQSSYQDLKSQMHYYVKKGLLISLRRGLYAKPIFSVEEAACKVYIPSYISLETILQRAGVIFQYYNSISVVSYKSTTITLAGKQIHYRRIDPQIASAGAGIVNKAGLSEACPERAFLDLVYLDGLQHFDHLEILDKQLITKILPIYNQKALIVKVRSMLDL